jgi:hypothetical protein
MFLNLLLKPVCNNFSICSTERMFMMYVEGTSSMAACPDQDLADIITYLVFKDPDVGRYRDPSCPVHNFTNAARIAASKILKRLTEYVQDNYPKDYLATIFKNAQKNEAIELSLLNPEAAKTGQTMDMFPEF